MILFLKLNWVASLIIFCIIFLFMYFYIRYSLEIKKEKKINNKIKTGFATESDLKTKLKILKEDEYFFIEDYILLKDYINKRELLDEINKKIKNTSLTSSKMKSFINKKEKLIFDIANWEEENIYMDL